MTNIVKHSNNTNNLTVFNPFDREQASIMKEMALDMAYSDLVPDMYRFKETDPDKMAIAERKAVANCMIAMNMALRMGAEPLMVMQNMYIVQGRPSWSSKFLIATVNTCGRFTPMQYKIENKGKIGVLKATRAVWKLLPGESQKRKVMESYDETAYKDMDDITCVAYATDLASGKELISSVVSIKMACLEGWYDKDGSKWKTMPEKMLRYRAASFWTNEYAPEISMGMRTEEEAQDIIDTDYEDVTNQKVSANVQSTIDKNANTKTIDFEEKEPDSADENKSAIQPSEKFEQPDEKKEDSPEVKMNF